ncbi:MAG: VTT domain-containing protein [Saprospiraceae bacterium]|nr:VTT domain-containing protein [Saprospiraceae bacterium]
MRLFLVFLGLAAIVLITFFIWGDSLMMSFNQEGTIVWLNQYGAWAWFAAILLLMADLILPLPATLIMSALGFIYGPILGGSISVAGSFMAGSAGYWICRSLGEKAAIRILGPKDFERGKKLSKKVGGWVVVLSRWLPVFPEVVACMAGLTRMKASHFHLALLCGSLPMGFTYALVGAAGLEHPVWAIGLSMLVPPVIWWWAGAKLKNKMLN